MAGRYIGPFRPLGGSSLATELVPVPSSTDGLSDSILSLQALARNFLLRNNLIISLSEPSPQEEGQDASFTPRVPRHNALL